MTVDTQVTEHLIDEQTPLLADNEVQTKHNAVYNRFTKTQKRTILFLIALAGLSPLFISGSFIPSIPQIAKDLGTTGAIVNIAVSLSIITNALGSLLWASYSSYYGRKPIYLLTLSVQCLGSLGVASARSVPTLLAWRIVQAFGSSSGLSVGMGVIGDIYKIEERGTASGVFFAAVLLGPALAPLVGGITAHYYSWRIMQLGLSLFALICLILTIFLQPETSQPGARGIDKAREKGEKDGLVYLNPFKSLWLLRSPNIALPALEGAFVLISDYTLIVPIAYTIGKKYDITNEAIVGALCIPLGLGNCIGAPLSGMLSDRILIAARNKRGGAWVPEDRLRASLIGAALFVPCSILFEGIILHFVDGNVGLVLICICFFFNGLGVDFVLSPLSAYNVDILHDRSAEVIAASMAFRSMLISGSVVLILPAIETFGVLATNTAIAVLCWIGFTFTLSTIKYGDRMRAWVDLGFSTVENN
ncbi:major facilitator superfamily domain-containing protein [Irpex rosettiformis]|uniref:Major facilitator superfamily domain-containing protein n=1 Tax=Irpex rosettiformis TaxID=378272 RepID=A0ACB8TV24_9APHY|nr:major facilitator superfamily domain-containing protein [Irpex rosettiformis]